jgi:DNA-binding MarR family transcriptional regulator
MKQSPTIPASASPRAPRAKAADAPDAIFALLGAADALHERLERAMGEVGLSMAKYGVLRALAEAGEPLTLTELAAGQRCVRSNITQLVDRLEADGLVKRADDPDDRRTIRAALTASGKEKAAAGARALAALQREISSLVSAPDRAAVARLLSALK